MIEMIEGHYKTIQAWAKSASLNRENFLKHEEAAAVSFGVYKVRMEGSNVWQIMERAPLSGVQEWLYLSGGVPIFYWNRNKDGLMLI